MTASLQSLLGILAFLFIAWSLSENRRVLAWRTVTAGILLQFALALIILKIPVFQQFFFALNHVVDVFNDATQAGTSFVFGYLGGGPAPFETRFPQAEFVFAFRALPLVLVMSALSALLFYWRVLPLLVKALSLLLERMLGLGGAVCLGAAANVFLGMVEAPLFVRPYLKEMSRAELFITMSCGMATVSGTVMVLYATIVGSVVPDAMGHILIASLISAPAAIVVSILMVPSTTPMVSGEIVPPVVAHSSMDAITRGTEDGIKLLINIVAMLVVLVALVQLANTMLGLLPPIGDHPVTLQVLLGYLMAPIVWLAGIPWSEAMTAGALMGTKTIVNEFIAYVDLAHLDPGVLSPRSRIIMTYALCGFANLGSLGILIGGMSSMCPERRGEIVQLGAKTLISGTLATCMTGAVVGIVL